MTTPRIRARRGRRSGGLSSGLGAGINNSTNIGRATRDSRTSTSLIRTRVAAKALGAADSLRASITQTPLNEDEFRELFSLADKQAIASRLGLPADTDLEALFADPTLLSSLNPDGPDRARELYDETHVALGEDSQQYKPPVSLEDAEEMGFFEKNFPITRAALGSLLERLPESTLDIGESVSRGLPGVAGSEGLGLVFGFLDVFAETTVEAGAQIPKLKPRRLGELEAPTLFTEGAQESLDQFLERPFKEQLVMSLLDPSLFAGPGRLGLKVATGSLGRIPVKAVAEEAAFVAARKKLREEAGHIGILPEADRLDAMVKPRDIKLFGKEAPAFVRRIVDPSGELRRLPLDSPERFIGEASLRRAKGQIMSDEFVEITMAWARSRSKDVDDLWGLPKKRADFPEPRASKVTHRANGTELKEAPLHGNVIERPHLYRLTDAQVKWIDDIKQIFPETLKYMQAEGLDVKEFGKWEEMFNFFPRKVIDKTTRKSNIKINRGSNIGKHRVFDEMDTAVLAKSSSYAPWEEATAAHLKGMYKAILDKRLADELEPLARSQTVDKRILRAQKDAADLVKRQTESIRDVRSAIKGFVPGAQTIRGMQRRFPDLADRIGQVFQLKPTDIDDIVRSAFPDPDDFQLASQFRREMVAHLEGSAEAGFKKGSVARELGDTARKSRFIDEYLELARTVRKAEKDPRTTPLSEEAKAIGPQGDPEAFSRARGHTDAEIADFKKLTRTMVTRAEKLGIELDDLQALEFDAFGATGGTRESRLLGRSRVPRDLKRSDVLDVIKKMGLDKADAARVRIATVRQTEKLFAGARKAELDALVDRMDVIASRTKEVKAETSAIATKAKERAGTTRSGEARGPTGTSLQDKIFDSATAVELEKVLVDNGSRLWQPISRGVGVLRQLRTIFDFGAPFIQGLPVLFRDPRLWGEATAAHYQAFVNPAVRGRYIASNAFDITEMVEHGGLLGSSEFTESMADGGWFARISTSITNSGHVPEPLKPALSGAPRIVSVTAQRFSNSFETFLDLSRVEMWKSLRPLAKTPDDLDDVASFVNHLTGVMSPKALGIPLSQQEFEAAVPFFAPRYARAIASLYNDIFRGGIRGDQARKSLGGLLFGAGAMHVAIATALGQEPNLDPTRAGDFMRIELEGQKVGFVPKPLTYFKNLAKITKTSFTEPDKFLSLNVFNSEDVAENPLLQTIQNQSSILTSTGIGMLRGSDPIGRIVPGFSEPVDAFKHYGQDAFPFWIDAALEADGAGAIVAAGSEILGGSTFPVPPWERANDLLEKYSQEDYGVSWDTLKERSFGGQTEKRAMMLAHDDLRATQELADAEQLGRANSQEKRVVLDELSEIRSDWLDNTSKAGDNYLRLLDGSNSPLKFRQEVGQAGAKARGGRTTTERLHPKVYTDFNEIYDDVAEEDPAQAARQEFFDKIATAVNPITGRTDYAIVDRIREEIDLVYGAGMMDTIDEQQRTHQSQLLEGSIHPVVQEYFSSFEVLRPYWEAFRVALPEEQWEAWQVFANADDLRKESFRRSQEVPYFGMERQVKIVQEQIQRVSPEIDLALLRFYGRTPQNRENILQLQANHRKRLTSGP